MFFINCTEVFKFNHCYDNKRAKIKLLLKILWVYDGNI